MTKKSEGDPTWGQMLTAARQQPSDEVLSTLRDHAAVVGAGARRSEKRMIRWLEIYSITGARRDRWAARREAVRFDGEPIRYASILLTFAAHTLSARDIWNAIKQAKHIAHMNERRLILQQAIDLLELLYKIALPVGHDPMDGLHHEDFAPLINDLAGREIYTPRRRRQFLYRRDAP